MGEAAAAALNSEVGSKTMCARQKARQMEAANSISQMISNVFYIILNDDRKNCLYSPFMCAECLCRRR